MKHFVGLLSIFVTLAAGGVAVQAQQQAKIHRIGFMIGTSPSIIPDRVEGFRRGLRELGYVEGKNIFIEWRYAEGKLDRSPRSRPNWFFSRLMSSSRVVQQ